MTDLTSNFADLGLTMPKTPRVRRPKGLADPLAMPPGLEDPLAAPTGRAARRKPRVSIDELNTMGVDALKEKYPDLPDRIQDTDPRTGFEKVLDWIDLPRNAVANVIGSIAGVDKSEAPRAAMGLPRVNMSDVLDKLGMEPGVARSVIGFVGDVAIDPLTYIGGIGVKGAAWAPRSLEAGREALQGLAKGDLAVEGAATAAKAISATRTAEETASVLSRLKARWVGQGISEADATARLMGPEKGLLMDSLEHNLANEGERGVAARALASDPKFFSQGKPLLRIPGTELGVGRWPIGKQNRIANAIAAGDYSDPIFQRIRDLKGIASRAGKTAAVGTAARKAANDLKAAASQESLAVREGEAGANFAGPTVQDAAARLQDLTAKRKAAIPAIEQAAKDYSLQIAPETGGKYQGLVQALPTRFGENVDRVMKSGKLGKGRLDLPRTRTLALEEVKKQAGGGQGPDILQLFNDAQTGKGAPWNPTGLRQRLLGWLSRSGYHGKAVEQTVAEGIRTGKGPFADAIGPGGFDQLVRDMAVKHAGGDLVKARQMIRDAQELAPRLNKNYLANLHADDPALLRWEQGGVKELAAEPAVQKWIDFADRWHGQMRSRGALVGGGTPIKDELGYVHRIRTPEAAAAEAVQLGGRQGQKGIRPAGRVNPDFRLADDTAYDLQRSRLREFTKTDAAGNAIPGSKRTVLDSSQSEINNLLRQGYAPTVEMTMEDGTTRLISGLSADKQAALQEALPGAKFTEKTWMPSSAWYDERAKGGGLKTLFGPAADTLPNGVMESDLPRAMGSYARSFQTKAAGRDLTDWAMQHRVVFTPEEIAHGRPELDGYAAVPNLPGDHPLRKLLPPGILDAAPNGGQAFFPREMAESIRELADVVSPGALSPKLQNVLKVSDTLLKWFKFNALLSPAYTIRNVFQNVFGITMAGGDPLSAAKWAIRTKSNADLAAVMRAIDNGTTDMLPNTLIKIGPQRISQRALGNFLLSRGADTAGLTGAEFAPTNLLREAGAAKSAIRRGVGAVVSGIPRTWRGINSHIESRMRLGAMLSFMEKGYAPEEAYFKTLLGMPDLNALSKVERNVVARIFPWWRWMRNNGSVQVMYHLTEHPGFMASTGKLQHFLEGMSASWRPEGAGNVPEQLRPEWQRESQATQIWGDKNQGATFLLKPWFPFQEAEEAAAGLLNPSEGARSLLSSMRPGAKFVAESATGSDVFRNRPVQQLDTAGLVANIPQALMGRGESQPLANAIGIRGLKEYGPGGRVYDQPTAGSMVGRAFLGGAVQPVNAQSGLKALDWETQQKQNEIRRQIARAQSSNDQNAVMDLLRQLVAVQQRRAKLGLPLAKKGGKVLQDAGVLPGQQFPDIPYQRP